MKSERLVKYFLYYLDHYHRPHLIDLLSDFDFYCLAITLKGRKENDAIALNYVDMNVEWAVKGIRFHGESVLLKKEQSGHYIKPSFRHCSRS